MTPSPSPSPSSSPSSRPSSTPAPVPPTPSHPPPPSTPPTLPPISQLPLHPDYISPSLDMGASVPSDPTSTPKIPTPSRKRSRHGKNKADASDSVEIFGPIPTAQGSAAGPSTSRGSFGEPDHQQPRQQAKKKRTRTLTTPHQSAVLHALLAQSRFPTTAMREEVGRSIGLSARKVQVWFQNQRQKSRKPRDTPSVSTSLVQHQPPQFGPFAAGPSTMAADVSLGPLAIGSPSPSTSGGRAFAPFHGAGSRGDHATGVTPYVSPPHLGPREFTEYPTRSPTTATREAYPGSRMSLSTPPPPSRSSDSSGSFNSPPHFHRPHPGPPGYLHTHSPPYPARPLYQQPQLPSEGYMRHFLSAPGPSTVRSTSPPVVLPPLRLDSQQQDQSRESPFRHQGPLTLPPPPLHHGLPLPALPPRAASFPSLSPSEHDRERVREDSPPRARARRRSRRGDSLSAGAFPLPPPFTLQPEPQWDLPALLPGARAAAAPISILRARPLSPPPPPQFAMASLSMPQPGFLATQGLQGSPRPRTASDPTRMLHPGPQPVLAEPWSAPAHPPMTMTAMQRGGVVGAGTGTGTGTGTGSVFRRFDPVHEAVGVGGGVYASGGGSDAPSRGTYDFARSPAGRSEDEEMADVQPEEEARHEPEGGRRLSPHADPETEHRG